MREKLIILFIFFMGLAIIFLPLSKASTGSNVGPVGSTVSKSMQCYGTSEVDSNTWKIGLNCSNNEASTSCINASHPSGIQIGYSHTCDGGDWWTPCTDHCNMLCATSENPASNCQWR